MAAVFDHPPTNKKTPFNETELNEFKSLILKKIQDAEDEITFLQQLIIEMRENSRSDSSSSQHHIADIGSNEAAMQVNFRLLERTQKFVRQLQKALKRIENGTYGICKITGKPIAKQRLLAAPHTQHSMEAKLMRLNRYQIN